MHNVSKCTHKYGDNYNGDNDGSSYGDNIFVNTHFPCSLLDHDENCLLLKYLISFAPGCLAILGDIV